MTGGLGSFADPHDTPKPVVRAAGMGGIGDLAIRQNRPFARDKFWEEPRELERQVLAETRPTGFQ